MKRVYRLELHYLDSAARVKDRKIILEDATIKECNERFEELALYIKQMREYDKERLFVQVLRLIILKNKGIGLLNLQSIREEICDSENVYRNDPLLKYTPKG